jgi:hypothetical protein
VVINDDDVHSDRLDFADPICGSSPAIQRDEQLRRVQRKASLHAFFGEAITFFQPVWQEGLHIGSEGSHHAIQERNRSDAVYIVVAVQNDRLAVIDREKNSFDSLANSTDLEWIAQIAQSWKQKLARFSFLHQAYSRENVRQSRRYIQLPGDRQCVFQSHWVRKVPETVHTNIAKNAMKVSEGSSLCSKDFWVGCQIPDLTPAGPAASVHG